MNSQSRQYFPSFSGAHIHSTLNQRACSQRSFPLDFSGLHRALEAGTHGLLTALSYDGEQH